MQRDWPEVNPAIGIFGGTFDPVHFGHLRAALEAREKLAIDDFRLLPAGTPALRSGTVATPRQRLAMLKCAVAGISEFTVDDRECRREGTSFMVDTLTELRGEVNNAPLVLVVGQDAANQLDSWHDWKSLFELAHLAVMRRPGAELSWSGEVGEQIMPRLVQRSGDLLSTPAGSVLPLQVTQLAISSTDIRRRLEQGYSPRFLMPDSVLHYIEQNRLYFAGKPRKG